MRATGRATTKGRGRLRGIYAVRTHSVSMDLKISSITCAVPLYLRPRACEERRMHVPQY